MLSGAAVGATMVRMVGVVWPLVFTGVVTLLATLLLGREPADGSDLQRT
jgi:hypothetical protein